MIRSTVPAELAPGTADAVAISHTSRIAFLDGLRGLAIGLVVLFHAYARWPGLYPYGADFTQAPVLAQGSIGVDLFFIISGFVILMSLERCTGIGDFLLRRWLRLFPAMLICSLLLYASASLFPERPTGLPRLSDLIPGLTFIDPDILWRALGLRFGVIEGVLWSIFVEVKFYLIFGCAFFLLGRWAAVALLLGLFAVNELLALLELTRPLHGLMSSLLGALTLIGASHFGWFATGALFHLAYRSGDRRILAGAGLVGIGGVLTAGPALEMMIAALAVLAIFAACIVSAAARGILASRGLVLLGFVSYPLYLLHESMMVAMIVKLGRVAPGLPGFIIPALPIMIVVGLAWLVAAHAEPAVTGFLRPMLSRLRRRHEIQSGRN